MSLPLPLMRLFKSVKFPGAGENASLFKDASTSSKAIPAGTSPVTFSLALAAEIAKRPTRIIIEIIIFPFNTTSPSRKFLMIILCSN